jgi:hypothetical protein
MYDSVADRRRALDFRRKDLGATATELKAKS